MKAPPLISHLADLRITAVLLLVFALETLAGTLMQAKYGLYAAQQLFFHNWFGVPFVGALALLNLSAVLFFRLRWTARNAGLLVLHLGLICLLGSAGLGWLFSENGFVDLGHGESSRRAESVLEWELAFRVKDDSGSRVWSLPLQTLKRGRLVNLGPHFPPVSLQAMVPNGAIGPGNTLIPMQASADPERWSPALMLSNGIALTPNSPPWSPQASQELTLRHRSFSLPFTLHLKSFRREYHPGTQIASSYESTLAVVDANGHRTAKISMNQPLRIGDYTIFQSSWSTDAHTGLDRSILAITRNPLRNGPYAATLLIALGMILHMLLRIRKPKSSLPMLLLVLCGILVPSPSHAQTALRAIPTELAQLPIHIDGRIKPLETYAHHLLLQISGRSTLLNHSAMQWFAGLLLGSAMQDSPVFLIESPELRDALGLQGKERDRYTWQQLLPMGLRLDSLAAFAQSIPPEVRTPLQRDLLRVADSWNRYYSVLHALDFAKPDKQMSPYSSFLHFAQHSSEIRPRIDRLLRISPDSLDINGRAYLAWVDGVLGSADSWATTVFPTLPALQEKKPVWMSPGEILLKDGLEDPVVRSQLEAWSALREAWNSQQPQALGLAAAYLAKTTLHQAQVLGMRTEALVWEHRYNQLDPFYRSLLLYFVMLVPALLGLRLQRTGLIQVAAFLGLATLALQSLGISMRMWITLRPPVTNLYETFVFASACSAFLLLVWGHFRKFQAAPALAAIAGSSLLLLARRYGSDGDTMPVLAAVLNSNFWLTIHVLTITVGYAGVVAAGLVAHWHLVLLRRHADPQRAQACARLVREIMGFGLVFTFLGTLLGGIWADQSWGRFWGWDPKENGALLIILWVAFQFHAVPAGWMRDRGFSLASLIAVQTVVFAWFGVNLMGVGLHSYGFTQGTLVGIFSFALFELVFAFWSARGTRVPRDSQP